MSGGLDWRKASARSKMARPTTDELAVRLGASGVRSTRRRQSDRRRSPRREQLSLLRDLCRQAGVPYQRPTDRADASSKINAVKGRLGM